MPELRKGRRYLAGVDKPALASWGAIRDALRDHGLELLAHTQRDKPALPFDPRGLPGYSDGWDAVALVEVRGGSGRVDLPDRVKWLLLAPTGGKPPVHGAVENENPAAIAGAASGAAADLAAREASLRAREKVAVRSRRGGVAIALGVFAAYVLQSLL